MPEIRRCACGCGTPLPSDAPDTMRAINPTHAKRAQRARMGTVPGHGAPSPSPRGSPPSRRPPPEPDPPVEPPLPINDPTVLDRAFAEARALLALEHVEAVLVRRDGQVSTLRSGPRPVVLTGCYQDTTDDGIPPSFREFCEARREVRQ